MLDYSFDQMAELASQVVARSIAVPGVQPKLSLSLVKETLASGQHKRLTVVGTLGGGCRGNEHPPSGLLSVDADACRAVRSPAEKVRPN